MTARYCGEHRLNISATLHCIQCRNREKFRVRVEITQFETGSSRPWAKFVRSESSAGATLNYTRKMVAMSDLAMDTPTSSGLYFLGRYSNCPIMCCRHNGNAKWCAVVCMVLLQPNLLTIYVLFHLSLYVILCFVVLATMNFTRRTRSLLTHAYI